MAGSASPKLSARVAKQLKCKLITPELWRFPDGEFYVRVRGKVKDEDVVIVQSTYNPQNDNLIELCLLSGAAKDLGAKHVTAVVPYLSYARQDKRFKPGEAISIHTVCKMIDSAGADKFITIDVHEDDVIQNFSIAAKNLTAMHLLGKYLKELDLENPVILGADQGSLGRARKVANELRVDYDYLEKRRVTPRKVITSTKHLDIAGRDVVLADDIISTGGTIIEAARILKRQRAGEIYAVCTHAVLVGNSLQKIRRAGVKTVIATDTIEHPTSRVSVAPIIANAVQ